MSPYRKRRVERLFCVLGRQQAERARATRSAILSDDMPQRTATILSNLFQPMLTGTYVLLAIALTSATTWTSGVAWGVGLALLTAGVPSADIFRRMRVRTVDDFHIVVRTQRLGPLLVALSCTAAGLALALAMGAPHPLQASLLVALVTGVVLTSITGVWKISFHAATAVSALVILTWWLGWGALALAPLAPAVAWSRVALGRHSSAQVVAGGAVGATLALAVLALY
ncbi:MAG TPA: phosphatase PAP2 family protein [Thermoleophilia bacterium]|nr:phosphatase PAP2 family protein [Thermoleophilia bacterium]